MNLATTFLTDEVIHYNITPGFEDGLPTFGATPAGSNIPPVYPPPAKANPATVPAAAKTAIMPATGISHFFMVRPSSGLDV